LNVTRRSLLANTAMAAAVGSLLPAAGSFAQSASSSVPPKRMKFVVTGGHPGDPEYGCGGTVARLTRLGHEVVLLYLNDGAWPPTPASVRLAEAQRACELLKAKPKYAGQNNGHAILDKDHFDLYRKVLEAENADAVFTHWPLDNHRDHRACWDLTFDSWRQMGQGQKVPLYYYEVSNGEDTFQFSPTHYVDITETESTKRTACYAHASQTPDRYYTLQDQVAAFRGIEFGTKRAEAFLLQSRGPGDVLAAALQSPLA
jgi:N-acetylglucosamine malate deacetylase 1